MSSTDPSAPPGWQVVVDKPAQKQLDRLPPRDFGRVDVALVFMAADPFGGDLERLTKHDRYSFRRRVGDYRILFNVDTAARRVLTPPCRCSRSLASIDTFCQHTPWRIDP
jgi:mRNA-degrading endonuclease RelE of RelBE toxin-antitoxin system